MFFKLSYTYDGRGGGPDGGLYDRDTLQIHHIIPVYRIGFVSLVWYAAAEQNKTYRTTMAGIGFRLDILNDTHNIKKIEGNNDFVTYQFDSNSIFTITSNRLMADLFIGPKARYREDDPKQGTESSLPESIPNHVKFAIQNLASKIRVSELPRVQPPSGNQSTPFQMGEILVKNADEVLGALRNVPAIQQIHDTIVSDWHVVITNDSNHVYRMVVIPSGKVNPKEVKKCKLIVNPGKSEEKNRKPVHKELYAQIVKITRDSAFCIIKKIIKNGSPTKKEEGELMRTVFVITE